MERLGRNPERSDPDRAIRREFEATQTTERRDVLILFADRMFEQIDLNLARLFCERPLGDVLATMSVKRSEKTDDERSR